MSDPKNFQPTSAAAAKAAPNKSTLSYAELNAMYFGDNVGFTDLAPGDRVSNPNVYANDDDDDDGNDDDDDDYVDDDDNDDDGAHIQQEAAVSAGDGPPAKKRKT